MEYNDRISRSRVSRYISELNLSYSKPERPEKPQTAKNMFNNELPLSKARQARKDEGKKRAENLIAKLSSKSFDDLMCLKALSPNERKSEIEKLFQRTRGFKISMISQCTIDQCLEIALDNSTDRLLKKNEHFLDFVMIPDIILETIDSRMKEKVHNEILRM